MGRLLSSRRFELAGVLLLSACALVVSARAGDQHTAAQPPLPTAQDLPSGLISLTASTPQELERQGDQLRAQKRYLDAVDYYQAAIGKQPTTMLWNKLGMANLFLQRDKQAQKCFDRALKLDKNSPEALNNRGFIEQLNKNYGKAIKYYQKALAVRPSSPTFHYNLASVYFAKHDFSQAAAEFRTAYMLDPDIFNRVSRVGIMAQTSSPEDRAAFLVHGGQDVRPGGRLR